MFHNRYIKYPLSMTFIILLYLLVPSCNYHYGTGNLSQRYSTISIPYVVGDVDGELTAAIIRQFETKSSLRYEPCVGNLILSAKLLDTREENVGFRYDRKKSGHLKKYIIPTESRRIASVEISLIESSSQRVIIGPTVLTAAFDFDHEYYSDRNAANVFSLGQLVDIDTARDTVAHPLNQLLAEKIFDYIINSW